MVFLESPWGVLGPHLVSFMDGETQALRGGGRGWGRQIRGSDSRPSAVLVSSGLGRGSGGHSAVHSLRDPGPQFPYLYIQKSGQVNPCPFQPSLLEIL